MNSLEPGNGGANLELSGVVNSRRMCVAAAALQRIKEENDAEARAVEHGATNVRPKKYAPVITGCTACKGTVELMPGGGMRTSACVISGSCEDIWVKLYPEHYRNSDGSPTIDRVPCGGERCGAVLQLATSEAPQTFVPCILGVCAVDREGEKFRRDGHRLLNNMPLTSPDVPEPFDGQLLSGEAAV